MRARYRTWLWLLLVGLAPQAGCVTLTDATVSFQAGPKTPDGSTSTPTLPDDEAERVCLKVAAEMGRNGHPREAIDELERARARDPRLDVTHRLALLYEQTGTMQGRWPSITKNWRRGTPRRRPGRGSCSAGSR